ncbi:10606_t:CDS:1, partial [Paraglomus brasilianum]
CEQIGHRQFSHDSTRNLLLLPSPQQGHSDFEKMTVGHPIEDNEVLICAAYVIFGYLLNQLENKTLLVIDIDEHGALFEYDLPMPKKQLLNINSLMQLSAWNEERRGTCVVLTGTAHAKFETPLYLLPSLTSCWT